MTRKSKTGTSFVRKVTVIVAMGMGLIVLSPCLFMVAILGIQEINIRTLTHIPPDTQFIHQAQGRWGANAATRKTYYQSSWTINELEAWYQGFYPPFEATPYDGGRWRTTSKSMGAKYDFNGDEITCTYQDVAGCVSVALIDLRLHRPLDLIVVSYGGFRIQEDDPLYALLDALPKTGTLIIYTAYVSDW